MKRFLLLALFACIFPATSLLAQKPFKNMEELQQTFNDAGLTSEIRKDAIAVAIPETKWEVYTYLTGRGSKVWFYFTCQPLPKDAPAQRVIDLLKANDFGSNGCYFSVGHTGNIYINMVIDNRGITGDQLREKVNMIADFATKHGALWDTKLWSNSSAAVKEEKPKGGLEKTTNNEIVEEKTDLSGKWNVTIEENGMTLQGTMEFNEGKFKVNVSDKTSDNPAIQIEGSWKLSGKNLELTANRKPKKEFELLATVTGSKTEYQFFGTNGNKGKLIVQR